MSNIDGGVVGTKDNEISFVEFCRILRAKSKGMEPASIQESIRKLFHHYDRFVAISLYVRSHPFFFFCRDHNGQLDAKEIKKLLGNMGLKHIDV